MDRLPSVIRVERHGSVAEVFVDGEPFPYLISRQPGVHVVISPDEMPYITVTLMANRVEVVDSAHDET